MNELFPSLHLSADTVILVDQHDQVLGHCDKLAAHQQGLLHRAFSVFVLRRHQGKLELLLQQRALEKYHSGGLWANSCCGHPRPDESTMQGATRRLSEELGIHASLTHLDSFIYQTYVEPGLTEHEFDHVFIAWVPADIKITMNPQEVMAVSWCDIKSINDDYKNQPHKYSPWFKQAFDIMYSHIDQQMSYQPQLTR